MAEFRMPSLGADMESGTIVEWRVKPGDRVQRGDIVAVVDTEKSDIEVEVFDAGMVQEILVPVGEKVAVGTVLARLDDDDALPVGGRAAPEPVTAAAPEPVTAAAPEAPPVRLGVISPLVRHRAEELGVDIAHVVGTGPGGVVHRSDVERAAEETREATAVAVVAPSTGFVRASPRARRRAVELAIALDGLVGSGPDGSVTEADVEQAAASLSVPEQAPRSPAGGAPPRPLRSTGGQKPAMRRAIAALMERANREIPHYYLQTTIDLQPALDWLAAVNLDRPVTERVIPTAMLLKATALAAREVPELNGFWVDDSFQPATSVHLGVAISLRGGGLVAPAILDADRCTLVELMVRLRDLVDRARSGVLRASEMSAPTLTVSNLGDQGAEAVYGVIYPPQVALVGFGRIAERPWAHEHLLGVRSVVTATLAADHRAGDGHVGGLFLKAIDRLLQRPEEL
ncbi:MAG: 2-oxo acid dehydrogenase subunit E2 [Actinobacteria bacterium]|nr:2-oxo acid dehydrogenase subunit E2 [Actinomycetota bacterium]